jgi:hypothetical protein
MTELTPHPLCKIVRDEEWGPTMEETAALQASVAEHGPVDRPITIDADNPEQVLDGWSFKWAWEEAARHDDKFAKRYPLERYIQVREFANEAEKIRFVIGRQLGRRNLTPVQRLRLVRRLLSFGGVDASVLSVKSLTNSEIACYLGISGTSVKLWKRVEREAVPEVQKAFDEGKITLKEAGAVAGLSDAEQREIAESGPEALKAKAAEVQGSKGRKAKAATNTQPTALLSDGKRTSGRFWPGSGQGARNQGRGA